MSDLYYEATEPAGTAAPGARESGHGTSAGWQTEAAEPAVGHGHDSPAGTDGSGDYDDTQAVTEARIAGQDELPSPAQSRAATWGDSPEYYDEADLASEYDGDLAALLAAEDDLPTPQESRARTWGDGPEYTDEADLAPEDDGDPGTRTTEENSPAAWHAPARPDAPDAHANSAPPPEEMVGTDAQDADNRHQDAASTPGHQPDPPGTDLATTELGPAPETHATKDSSPGTQPGPPDQPELPGADADTPLSPEAERLKALEVELDEARQKIAELEAKEDEQAAPIDRIEQQLASTDRQPGDASTPEHGVDDPGISRGQDASLDKREGSDESTDIVDAKPSRWRRAVSADSFGAAATLIDATDTVRLVAMHATPGEVMVGLAATVFGLASLGLAKFEQHRKEKK